MLKRISDKLFTKNCVFVTKNKKAHETILREVILLGP